MYFDRFEIVEAHYAFCVDYHSGQGSKLYARLSRIISKMRFQPAIGWHGFDSLTDNSKAIYNQLEEKHGYAATR